MSADLDGLSIPHHRRAMHRFVLREAVLAPARPRRVRRRRLIVVAVAVAGLLAAPALAVVGLWPPWAPRPTSPQEAAQETGEPVAPKLVTTVDGVTWRFYVYRDASGALCTAAETDAHDSDTPTSGYGCQAPATGPLFPSGPVRLYGPGMSRNGGSPPDRWDRLWVYGLAKPAVARVALRFTDCVSRNATIATDSFGRARFFAYVEPQELLHRKVLPVELEAFDAAGRTLVTEPVAARHEPDGEPRPPASCG